ncbi:MAG: protein kinase [Planctomycetes bacterium]|nr:protein kinase [Planctomycetota bacterium]
MSSLLTCPACNKQYSIKTGYKDGRKFICKACGTELVPIAQAPKPRANAAPNPFDNAPDEVKAAIKNRNRVVLQKYVILNKLGEGGMGAVYKVWDASLNRFAALKIILISPEDDSSDAAKKELVERFIMEAKTSASLNHPNILQIYETGKYDNNYFIAMEFANGGTLANYIIQKLTAGENQQKRGKPRPPRPKQADIKELSLLFIEVLRGLHYTHNMNIIHRDIKPENILLEKGHSGRLIPKLADFGLAKQLKSNRKLTIAGTVVGTPDYMSPEQARAGNISSKSDIFSLGSVLYKIATGTEPFHGRSALDVMKAIVNKEPIRPGKVNPAVDHDMEVIILKALEKDPERRFADTEQFAQDLERWLKGDPILSRPPSFTYKIIKKIKRHKTRFAAAFAVIMLAVAGIIYYANDRANKLNSFREQGDTAFAKGDWDGASGYYTSYLVISQNAEIENRLKQCTANKLTTEKNLLNVKNKAEKDMSDQNEALKIAQEAWTLYGMKEKEFYKKNADMESVWSTYNTALRNLDAANRIFPTQTGFFYKGLILRKMLKIEQAIKCFDEALRIDRDFSPAYVFRGLSLIDLYSRQLLDIPDLLINEPENEKKIRAGNFLTSALEDFRHAYPGEKSIEFSKYFELATALKLFESGKDCNQCLEKLAAEYEQYGDEEFLLWQAKVLFCAPYAGSIKNEDESTGEKTAKLLEDYIDICPQSAEANFLLGVLKTSFSPKLLNPDSFTENSYIRKSIDINPYFDYGYLFASTFMMLRNDLKGALELLDKGVKYNPESVLILHDRAQIRAMLKDYQGALQDADTAEKIGSDRESIAMLKGILLNDYIKDAVRAEEQFTILINEYPARRALALAMRSSSRKSRGNLDGALDDITKALDIEKKPHYYVLSGDIYAEKKEWKKAIDAYTKSLTDPKNPYLLFKRGKARKELGDYEAAMEDLRASLNAGEYMKDTVQPLMDELNLLLQKETTK